MLWNLHRANRSRSAGRLAADFTGWKNNDDKFNEQLECVIKALRTDGGAREQPPKSRL